MKINFDFKKIKHYHLTFNNNVLIIICLFANFYCFSRSEFQSNPLSNNNKPDSCCKSEYSKSSIDSLSIEQLGKEYKRIKKLECEDCKIFGSDYHLIMKRLGTKLSGKSEKEIKRIMGSPDKVKNKAFKYYWRGFHDYLIFDFSDNKGAVSSWFHAYE